MNNNTNSEKKRRNAITQVVLVGAFMAFELAQVIMHGMSSRSAIFLSLWVVLGFFSLRHLILLRKDESKEKSSHSDVKDEHNVKEEPTKEELEIETYVAEDQNEEE